jgi:outer membrane receptor protein involved in Fe transport
MDGGYQRRGFLLLVVIITLGIWIPVHMGAQVSAANIGGTVYDQAGAVIPGARLLLVNVATGVRVATQTNDVGHYAIPDIMPGVYMLEASKPGFASSKLQSFTLAVSQNTTIDFHLSVGSTDQTVQVSASGAELQTSSSELGTVISSVSTESLPLNGRNFTQLLNLTAGASPANVAQNAGGFVGGQTFGSFSIPAVNGQTNRSDFFLLDGMNDQQSVASMYTIQPILDDVQEFKVVSHADQTQYGGVLGGIVNVVTKSGTNDVHGAAWEYVRNNDFDARNPFLPKTSHISPLHWNQFGGNAGGPFILPHIYNGRNRSFVFGSYEAIIIHRASHNLMNVPTPTELTGDLTGFSEQIYNPYSTAADGSRQPFMCDAAGNPTAVQADKTQAAGTACNKIPSALIDANMVTVAKAIYPAPINTGNPAFNALNNSPATNDNHEYSLRADEQLGQKDAFWWRFTHSSAPITSSASFPGLVSNAKYYAYQMVAGWRHTFGPTAILDVNFGRDKGTDYNHQFFTKVNGQALAQQAGFSNEFACGFAYSPHACLLPNINFNSGGFASGGENNSYDQMQNIYEWRSNFTKMFNRHMVSVGADLNYDGLNGGSGWINTNANSYLSFDSSQTADNGVGGVALASFLLGIPIQAGRRNVLETLHHSQDLGFYGQDTWRVTNRLNVTAGVRYDYSKFPSYGLGSDLSNIMGDLNLRDGTYVLEHAAPSCDVAKVAPCIPGGDLPAHVVVSKSGYLVHSNNDNIQPRLGITYRLRDSIVIRASGGRFFDNWAGQTQGAQNMEGTWPSTGQLLANNLNPGKPTTVAEDPFSAPGSATLPSPSPFNQVGFYIDPLLKNPESWQWNFGVEKQLGPNQILSANYVGSAGTRLDIGGFKNTAVTPGPGDPSLRYPYPYISPTFYDQSSGHSNYEGFQFSLEKKSSSFTYLVSYTLSQTKDVGCDGWFGIEGCSVQNNYNLKADKSVAGFDLPQMLSVSWAYQLPFGEGARFQTSSRAVNYVIGNWKVNGITSLSSGLPFTVFVSGDIANIGNGSERPNRVGDPHLSQQSPKLWFNPAAFAVPAQYTFGNVGRNSLRSDWYKDVDFSVFREFPTVEKQHFEFRAEGFNVTNTPTWGIPASTVGANFGVVGGTRSTERELQFALKYLF